MNDAAPMALLFCPLYTIGSDIGLIGVSWAEKAETPTLDVLGFRTLAPPASLQCRFARGGSLFGRKKGHGLPLHLNWHDKYVFV